MEESMLDKAFRLAPMSSAASIAYGLGPTVSLLWSPPRRPISAGTIRPIGFTGVRTEVRTGEELVLADGTCLRSMDTDWPRRGAHTS